MGTFYRPEHLGVHLLIGALVFSIGISLSADLQEVFKSGSGMQNVVSAQQLMRTSTMTSEQIEQARRARCTPGFSCRTTVPIYTRVSRREALQFAYVMGQGVNQ